MLDTGIDPNEPAMASYIAQGIVKYDEGLDTVHPGEKPFDDGDHHGISITDVIVRYSPQAVNALTIYPINIGSGQGTWKRIQTAVGWSADHSDISLANLSYWASPKKGNPAFEEQKQAAENLKDYANQKGTFIIGSAGNEGRSGKTSEEAVTGFIKNIRVGAMQNGGRVIDYSSFDPDVVGPTILPAASLPDGESGDESGREQIAFFGGTSAASPSVLSVAVWMAAYTDAPMQEIVNTIKSPNGTTDIYGPNSQENRRDGYGLVDALKVYDSLKSKGY